MTDTTHGIVVNVEATTEAIDYRQLKPALERCATTLGQAPKQIVADGDYTHHASVQAAADCGVDFYGSWQESWRPIERDACGRSGNFLANAFPYDSERDCFPCPAGRSSLAALDSVVAMAFLRTCTRQGRQFVRNTRSAANVLPRTRSLGGEERLRTSQSPRPQPHSRPR